MKTKKINNHKVNVVTLGCSKNVVDSEEIIGQLQANEIDAAHERKDHADVVIVNTCGFIEQAKEESIDTILHYAKEKSEGNIHKLYVTGCLSQRYKDDLAQEIPEVDAFFGTKDLFPLLKRFKADLKKELIGERFLTTPSHYAYLKIAEGCNRTCSFCAIPLMRGKHTSKPIEQVVKEAERLAALGVKELILIAQELTYYGLDLYKKRKLPELLDALNKVDGIHWIRLHYAYPAQFPVEIVDAIKRNEHVCNYLDIPLQHASNSILKAMRRNVTKEKTIELLQYIRSQIPNIAIRTTMLVGYPGETEQDFEELKAFVQKMQFERLGVFTYSHEEDTRAFDLEDDVPQETKNRRAEELMEIQQEISYSLNQEKIGQEVNILFDRREGEYLIGRSEFDSPEVDNETLVKTNADLIGQFASVKITEANDFDLYGNLVD